MHRRSKNLNAPLEVKENESRCTEEKKEAFFPDLSRNQKICKATKDKKASKKENLSDGNLVHLQSTWKHSKEKELYPSKEDVVSSQVTECFFGALKGDGAAEPALPLNSQENCSRSKPVSLSECYLTPQRDKAEEKSGCAASEKQRKKPVDFATVTIAEFGITPESFTNRPIGKSPTSLKYRRRSSIGVQGSPEHSTLIQYLAQQRSNRQKEAFTWQLSPFRHETLRSLKDKIDAFQTSFASVEEGEETDFGFSGLPQVDDSSQEAASYFSSDITEGVRSNAVSDPSRDKVNLVEEQSLEMPAGSTASVTAPITPPRRGNNSLNKCTPNGSHLRPVLKKTPRKQPVDSKEECSSGAVGRGGGESPAVSSCAETSEALHTENTERYSSEMPKKKRVTFGEVLSPEIFDENLPANTPLCRGAAPLPGSHSSSTSARSILTEEPLSQPNFDCSDECVEPLQELMEGPVAAEATSPAENAEAAETDKSDVIKTRSSTKRKQHSTGAEGAAPDFPISKATNTRNAEDTKNQKKGNSQRQKNTATSAGKKTKKTKNTNYGKRRKKKVKKSLYGEREMASKKPLLSPIPEIPEVFSSASSPNSPEANVFFSGNTKSGNADRDVLQKAVTERRGQTSFAVPMDSTSEDLNTGEANSSGDGAVQVSGDLQTVSDMDHKFSNIVPGFLQQETANVKEAEESGSLTENEKFQANLLLEQLPGLEFLDQDINVHEGAQITQPPQEDSLKVGSARRRRRSSSTYFAPVEKFEIAGNNSPVPSFNIEEILSSSQLRSDSLESFRRQSGNGGAKRVRRSMRFHKEGAAEGLAWIQVPDEMQKDPPLPASARKTRRTISTSILSGAENIHPREQNLAQCSAPGKENKDSAPLTDGPCRRWRRRSICVSTPQETGAWSQKRSLTNSVCRKSRGNQKHYEEVEIPLENSS